MEVTNSSKNTHQVLQLQQEQEQHHHLLQQQQGQGQGRGQGQGQGHQLSFGMMQSSSSSSIPPNFICKDTTGAYDMGELDHALFLYLEGQDQNPHHHHQQQQQHQHHQNHHPSPVDEQRQSSSGIRPTLNIFPSQPMHVEPSSKETASLRSRSSSGSKRPSEPSVANPRNEASSRPQPSKGIKREGNRKGATSSSEHEGPKTPDPKTLRRLAQNREAARKSRLRKKAYVQQLESSRIKLTQLEQELQRARAQGVFFGGGGLLGDQGLPVGMNGNLSSEAQVFDMEYARWLEEHHRMMCELQSAIQEHLPENELRLFVDNCIAHYDEIMALKSMVVKSDVFHIVSGMWKTPAERCFMWMGGFKPSEIIKIILGHIEPLTEQQIMGICGLQQSTHDAEEALNQGHDALNQSLSDTIASDALAYPSNMGNYMAQMALALNKLSTLEGFVRQADNLRHQTLHRLHQILTTRQAARCFLGIAEYYHRLRALSSLWLSRPRQD